jgi:septal ring factor EnvC (AmiA/AmiB activator)
MKYVAIIGLLFLTVVSVSGAESPKNELKGVKSKIKEKKDILDKTKKDEAVTSTKLQVIKRAIALKEAELGTLNRDLRGVESNLDRTGIEITKVSREANVKRAEIDKRLASLYKAGEIGAVRMFFSAESFPQLAENIRYMKSILENDKRIFAEYNQKVEQLKTLKSDLERDAHKKERIVTGIAQKKREIEAEKTNIAEHLVQVRQERKSHEAGLKELQANAASLQAMIKKFTERPPKPPKPPRPGPGKPPVELPAVPDRGFSSQKGRMNLPVRGSILESYGAHKHPEFNTYTFSKGISISAASGTDIKSIYDGTVIYAGGFKGYGNMMIIDHGGGYFSLYAHASHLAKNVGAEVKRSETIGAVGAEPTKGSMLYFEIRRDGKPVDPAGWVR